MREYFGFASQKISGWDGMGRYGTGWDRMGQDGTRQDRTGQGKSEENVLKKGTKAVCSA